MQSNPTFATFVHCSSCFSRSTIGTESRVQSSVQVGPQAPVSGFDLGLMLFLAIGLIVIEAAKRN